MPELGPSSLENDPLLRDVPVVDGRKQLDPAELIALIGRGGMGAVYRGKHLVLGIDVAVKCLLQFPGEDGEDTRARFRREARLAAQLTHENLVRLYELRNAFGLSYLILEYVDGEDAQKRVKNKGPLSETEAALILFHVTRGLAKAHRHRTVIVHRDIKPLNILISKRGEVKLADLGLAKAMEHVGEVSVHTTGVLGTPPYMAPEQWLGHAKITPATDVWALGATLYYFLTGRTAIRGETRDQYRDLIVNRAFPDPRVVRKDLSPEIVHILKCCTRRDPSKRYADASALSKALQSYLRERLSAASGRAQDTLPSTVNEVAEPAMAREAGAPHVTAVLPLGTEIPTAPVGGDVDAAASAADATPRVSRRRLLVGGSAVAALAAVTGFAFFRAGDVPHGWTAVSGAGRGENGWARRATHTASGIEFLLVESGEFWMGSPLSEVGRPAYDDETRHRVRITRPFYLAVTETSNAQYARLHPEHVAPQGTNSDHPVTDITWFQASAFCADIGCQLPTEAQWEFAARAGSDAAYTWGENPMDGAGLGNFLDQSGVRNVPMATEHFGFDDRYRLTCPTRAFGQNALGFFGMLGNVREWCFDAYLKDYQVLPESDPVQKIETDTGKRVTRGGSFASGAAESRLAARLAVLPHSAASEIGFRVAKQVE